MRIAEGENVNPILALIGNYSDPQDAVVVIIMADDSAAKLLLGNFDSYLKWMK